MKKLTVMVSLYNSGKWIENRLNNLFESDCINDIEIWCANANSPDELDDTIPQKFPVQYIKFTEHHNVYATWNKIIQASNSEYITNANTDDLIAPNGYSRLMQELDSSNLEYMFAYPNWYTTEHDNLHWSQIPALSGPPDEPGRFTGDLGSGGVGHFPMYSRSLHIKCGLYDERFRALGDADWWTRCYYIANAQFNWVREPLAAYLWRGNRPGAENLWHRSVNEDEWGLYHSNAERYKQEKQ